jgi:hypothetical protein
VSVTFYGQTADGQPIALDLEDPAYVNMANANARALLGFLGLDPGDELSGEITMPEARRAVMGARATFERRAPNFTREGTDAQRSGRCRAVEGGIDAGYLARRLDDFQRFLNAVVAKGATSTGGENRGRSGDTTHAADGASKSRVASASRSSSTV